MKQDHFFPALTGFYVLTADGQLGYYDQNRQFVLETALSQAFGEYNRQFLRAYLDKPFNPEIRLGIVYQPAEKRKWGSETLALETSVLKRLYGVSGPRTSDVLTQFQKKNREQSIYRGIELFLEYRNDHFPDAAIYAPVLFDRNTTLDQYPSTLDRPFETEDKLLPVVEVLNLLAGIAIPKRNTESVHLLVKTLHKSVVRKDVRKIVDYDLVSHVDTRPFEVAPRDTEHRVEEPISFPIPSRTIAQPGAEQNTSFDRGVEKTEHQLQPEMLTRFVQFRGLNEEKRRLLARTHPVHQARGGETLLKRGAVDSWNFYLLQGKLELKAEDGAKQIIEGGTRNASSPISFLKPRKYEVTTLTPVQFLWIHDSLLAAIVHGDLPTNRHRETGPAGSHTSSIIPVA